MPRKNTEKKIRDWSISYEPDNISRVIESKKELSKLSLYTKFKEIDEAYENRVSRILDSYGVHGAVRGLYRSFMEELVRAKNTYGSKSFNMKATALAQKYLYYGCSEEIIRSILSVFGVELILKTTRIITMGLG